MAGSPDPHGVLTARAWLEDGDRARLRVRVTSTTEALGMPARSVVVATVEECCEVVRDWLAALVDEATPEREGRGEGGERGGVGR